MPPLLPAQAAGVPEIAREGLPYWLAGLLLSVIVLLLVFIFLRDRGLRHRVNEFLSGAKKRVKRAQLRLKLKREQKRRTETLGDLGRKAWADRLPGEAYESCHANLALLDKEARGRQAEMQAILTGVLELRKRLDEIGGAAGDGPEKDAGSDVKEEEKRLKKALREAERKIRAGREELRAIEEKKAEQFADLGGLVDVARPDAPDYLGVYVLIDKHNRVILHLMNELEKFR